MGDYDRAIADQTLAIKIDPDYVSAYLRRGWTLIKKDDYAGAEADFAKALALQPDLPAANAGLKRAREYREHPEYAAQDREAAKGLSFEHFRRMVDKPQAPQQ
jgi:tetratricopeptide (TPR) repeat protein